MDEELRRLRRDASGDELVLALARAGLEGELVAEHGARTRAGGEVGAIVERAWETALERLVPRVVESPPVFTGASVTVVGPHVALSVESHLQLVRIDGPPPGPARAFRGWARVDAGLLLLEADGRLTRLTQVGAEEVSRSLAARTQRSERLHVASLDGEQLFLREQLRGPWCRGRIVRSSDGTTTQELGEAHFLSVSWRHDRVLVHDGVSLRRRHLSRPDEPMALAAADIRRFTGLHDGRLLELHGRVRVLDAEDASRSAPTVAGPTDLVDATLAPDGAALLALDLRGHLLRLPLDAEGEPAAWLEGSGAEGVPFRGVPRPEAAWHPWASAALVTTAAGCDVVGLDGRLLASLGPDRHGLGWSPDGRTALVVHAPNGAQAGALEAWALS